MSEPVPESIPTSQDPRSRRPTKKRALTPSSAQASQVEALFSHPEREVVIPVSATRDGIPKKLQPPPEIVANVQGSSAGAGSGEFHVYKASRRREYERLKLMDEETRKEKEKEEFENKQEELRKRDDAKTQKNKAKREKAKARKQRGKDGSGSAVESSDGISKGDLAPGAERAKDGNKGVARLGDSSSGEGNEQALAEENGFIIHDDG